MIYLHDQGIIHRDLSARNILVKEEEGKYTIRISDFGLSRELNTEDFYKSESKQFPVKWASNEVLKHRKYSTKSDVWSFGITLWEILEGGTVPYPDMDNSQALEAVLKGYRLPRPKN